MLVTSAVMAFIALAVPISTAVLHGRGGVPAHKEMTAEPGEDEPPLRYSQDGELFIFDDAGLNRHLPFIANEDEAHQNEQEPTGTDPLFGETSNPTQKTELQDTLVNDFKSTQIDSTESLIEPSTSEERRSNISETRRKTGRTEAERKKAPKKTSKKQENKDQSASKYGQIQKSGPFLIKIKNPDKNYVGRPLEVVDRQVLEGLVMGEFGNDYIGAVLVAQCIRDSMIRSGTNSAAVIKRKYGYTAPVRKKVSKNVKRAVAFVFDEGGSGVQHPIYYFYASNIVKSRWHETQKFIVQRKAVRFFSRHTR